MKKHRICSILLIAILAALCAPRLEAKDDLKAVDDYNFAVWLYNSGKYSMAIDSYQDFLKNHSGHEKAPDARFGLGQAFYHQGKFKEAADQFEFVRGKRASFEQMPDLLFQLAQARVELNQYAEAAKLFSELRSRFPNHYLADWALAREGACLIVENKPADAAPLLKRFLDKYIEPDKPARKSAATEAMLKLMAESGVKAEDAFMDLVERTFFNAALAQFNLRNFKEAGDSFKAFAERFPASKSRDEAMFRQAQSLYRQKSFPEAAELYRKVAEGRSDFAGSASFERALALHEAGKLKDAAAAFAQLAQRFPDSAQANRARVYSGSLLFDAGDYSGAIDRLKPLAAFKEIADEATYWIGMSLLKSGRNVEAERQFSESLEAYPSSPFAGDMRLGLADARLALGKNNEAAQAFREFARSSPNSDQSPRALYSAAAASHRAKEYGESESLCSEFMKRHSNHALAPQCLFLSAENRFLQKEYEQALPQYNSLLRRKATPPDLEALARFRVAWIHRYAKRFSSALDELAKIDASALEKDVADQALYLKGVCFFEQEKYEEAAAAFGSCLSTGATGPFVEDALLKQGMALMNQKQYELAKTAFARLLKEHPRSELSAQANFRMAECSYELKQYDAAIASYSKAADQKTPDELTPYAVFGLAQSYYSRGAWSDAVKHFDLLISQFKESELLPQALYQKGISLMKLKKWSEAETVFLAFAHSYQKHELARSSLVLAGTCLQERKSWKEAAAVLQSVIDRYPPDKDQPQVLYELAWSLREAEEEDESLAAFRALADKYPKDSLAADALFHLAESNYKAQPEQEQPDAEAKRLEAARSLYARALAASKDNRLADKIHYRMGWCDWLNKKYASAAAEFDKIKQDFPDSDLFPDALFQAGQSYAKAGEQELAAERYKELLENQKFRRFKYLPEARLGLGESRLALGEAALAEKIFTDWLRDNLEHPSAAHATYMLGRAKYAQKNYAGALENFNATTSLTRSKLAAEAQFYAGQAIQAQGDYAGAVLAYLRVEALYPDAAEWVAASLFEKGKCHEALGDKDEALMSYREVVEKYKGTEWASQAAGRLK